MFFKKWVYIAFLAFVCSIKIIQNFWKQQTITSHALLASLCVAPRWSNFFRCWEIAHDTFKCQNGNFLSALFNFWCSLSFSRLAWSVLQIQFQLLVQIQKKKKKEKKCIGPKSVVTCDDFHNSYSHLFPWKKGKIYRIIKEAITLHTFALGGTVCSHLDWVKNMHSNRFLY